MNKLCRGNLQNKLPSQIYRIWLMYCLSYQTGVNRKFKIDWFMYTLEAYAERLSFWIIFQVFPTILDNAGLEHRNI